MRIHPRIITLIYCVIITIITIIIEKIVNINILSTKAFFIIFIIGACIVTFVSWKYYDK